MDKQSLLALFSGAANSGWSLEEDVQLRKWLEDFAEELKRRTETVARDVQQLVEQTSVVELNLLNTLNSLQVLSATQFIENRVSEEDETSEANRKEPQISKHRAEDYEGDILPRYKEAVLTAWRAFEGLGGRKVKRLSAAERQISYARNEMENVQQHWKLPFIIGTEEFARDSECGLADFTFVGAYSRSGTPESDSDTERDEAQMAAEMVGTGILSEGEWSAIESEGSAHQGGVLEPAVSAALDFRAMLEAALRGPSLPYEDGMLPSQENPYGQYSYVDNAPTFSANKRTSNSPRTRSESGENKTDWDPPGEAGQVLPYPDPHTDGSHLENYMSYQTPDLDLKISGETDLGDSILKTAQDEPSSPPAYARAYDDLSKLAALVNSTVSKAQNRQQDPGPSTLPNQSSIHSGSSQQEWVSRSLLQPQAPPSSRNVSQASKSISAQITSMPSLSLGLFDHDSSDSQSISVQYQSQSGPMGDLAPIPTIPDELYQASHVAKSLFQEQPSSNDSGVRKSAQMETAPAKQSSQMSMEEDLTGGRLVNQKGAFARSNMMDQQGSLIKQNGSSTSKASFLPRPRTERTLPFKGGLFDEDDESEDEAVNVFGQRNTVGNQKVVSNLYQRESMQRPTSTSHSSRDKKGLFDDDESQPGHGSVPALSAGEFVTRDPLSSSPAVQGGHESPPRSQETVSDFADGQANIKLPREIAVESETHMAPEQLSAPSRNLSSFEYSMSQGKRIDMARTLAKAASLRGIMLQGGRPPSPPTRSRDSSSVFNEMDANSQHSRYGEGRGPVEDLQQDVNIGSLSASGSVAQSLVSPGEFPPDANQIAKLVAEGSIASQTIVGEKDVKEGLEGSHSHFLVAAVTANRAPIDSDLDDDTSISWSNSGSEGPEEGSDESLSKQAGGQKSTLHIPTDIRDGDAQQQSDLSGGAASVEEDVAAPLDNSGTNHTRDSGSEVVLPEKKVQGLLSKDARSSNVISASTGPGTSPVISPQESRAFSPTNTNRGPSLDHFLGSSVSASARASSAQSFQTIDEDLAQVHKSSSYHEGGHDIEYSSHTEMEPSDINSSLGSINNGSSNSASVGSRILFQGGGKVEKGLTPVESTPTIAARRFKSLFEDDDDEEEIFLPHLQPSRTLKGTVKDVREGQVQDLVSNESMYRGGHRSLRNPLHTSRNTMVERVARRPMIIDSQVQAASLENFDEKPINPLGPDVSPQFQELMKRETLPLASNQQKSGQDISLLTSTTEDIKTHYMISTDLKKSESLSPARAVQVPSKSTSALFFGDDNDEGEDTLFGPLGGQSSKSTEHKPASLLGIEGSSRSEDFVKSPIILGSVPSSPSTTVFGKALRRSLFDDAGNHPS